MYQTYPVGVEFFSYVKAYNKFARDCVGHVSKTFYRSKVNKATFPLFWVVSRLISFKSARFE